MAGTARDWVLRVVLGKDPEEIDRELTDDEIHPDLAELTAVLERIRADQPGPHIILVHHLEVLCRRGVRIASIRSAPVPHSARMRFADGTTIVIRSEQQGLLADLAVQLVRGDRIRLTRTIPATDVVRLELTTERGVVEVDATGFDQAD